MHTLMRQTLICLDDKHEEVYMKKRELMILCLLFALLLVSGCISDEGASSLTLTGKATALVGDPAILESAETPPVTACASDADCLPGLICDWVDPGYSGETICVSGCRTDNQCGVDGACDVPECSTPPCPGACILSTWQQAIDILGFEDASKWTATSGSDTAVDDAVQGQAALAVNGPGWQFVLTSDPFGPLPKVDADVSVAIKLPVEQPNPWWYGQLQLYVESPTLGLYNRFIGIAELTGLPTGEYVTVNFSLPADVQALLQGSYDDLKVTIALNVPYNATGQYLLDDLRFGNDIIPPVITLATSESPIFGTGPFKTFKEDIILLGHVEEDNAISDVIVTLDGGVPIHPTIDGDGNFSLPITVDRDFSKVNVTYPVSITAIDADGNETTLDTKISVISPVVPDELVIIFNKDTSDSRRLQLIDEFGGVLSKRLRDYVWLVKVPAGTAPDVIAAIGLPDSEIKSIFPNVLLKPQFIPNDTLIEYQNKYLISVYAYPAWDEETGSDDVVVAVVDSGVNTSMLINNVSLGGCGNDKTFVDNMYLNESECCADPPCEINDENRCVPSSDPEKAGACPVADLNGDGCPGECNVDDDGDGAADMLDPDVQKMYSNGFDDDGDGYTDERAFVNGSWKDCDQVSPGELVGAPEDGDCDGAANDDDENGYPDDCRGWNFGRVILPKCSDSGSDEYGTCFGSSAMTHPNQSNDTHNFQMAGSLHGTTVARVIGEPGNDCSGYAGIAHHVKILPLTAARYFPPTDDNDGELSVDVATMVEAYQYAGKAGAHIINSSLQAGYDVADDEFFSIFPNMTTSDAIQSITDLLNLSATDNALHVIAAGNYNSDTATFTSFPQHAQIDNMLLVGGSTSDTNMRWPSSNYGADVDLAAPADEVMGASGTSFAAPIVSGAAALLMSKYPELRGNPAVVADILRETTQYSAGWAGKSVSEGILNIGSALTHDVPDLIFINRTYTAMPASQDNATDDVDFFDADGDGRPDILEVSCSRANIHTKPHLRINDNMVFRDRTQDMIPEFDGSFCDAAEGDLDDDGRMDIVLAALGVDGSSADNQNRVLMNTGAGFVLDDTVLPSDDQRTRAVSLCDYDGDGDLDIYFGNVSPTLVDAPDVLLRNDGGNFTDVTAVTFGTIESRNNVHKILCADLDVPPADLCDGLNSSECAICRNPTVSIDGMIASGRIDSAKRTDCRNSRMKVIPELVLAGGEGSATLMLRQDALGVYQDVSCKLSLPMLDGTPVACAEGITPGRQDYDVASGDFNNDGAPDLVFVSRSGDPNPSNTLVYNIGDGTFEDVTADKWTITPDDSREVEVGDVNNDGWDDILVIRGNPNTMKPGANSATVSLC